MLPSLLRGVVFVGAAGLVAALSRTLGLDSPWPVLLVGAVALARPLRPGTIAAVGLGAVAWWVGMALRAGVLPDTASTLVIASTVAVGIGAVAATLSAERLPLWASLAGMALFAGLYEPVFAEEPTRFVVQSLLALATVAVAVGAGAVTAAAAEMAAAGARRRPASPLSHTTGEVA